jgi:large conductance mechanosensitive channel
MLQEFKKFILRGNVVDLAVAVVVGAAFTAVVNSLVANMITPLIAAFGGKHGLSEDFNNLTFRLHGSVFHYGMFVNSVISFLIIAAVVFFFVVRPLNILMQHLNPSDDVDQPAERECPHCLSAIPSAASRCKFCAQKVEPVIAKAED